MNPNILVFEDTLARINDDKRLAAFTQQSAESSRIYGKGFKSKRHPRFSDSEITFQETLTLIPAVEYVRTGRKTAVLNFANPIEPGGGVFRGASAQEEYLCRASNLYRCLASKQVKSYYRNHRELFQERKFWNDPFWGTDQVIYSPKVTVIKKDVGYTPGTLLPSEQAYTESWVQIDVITCAAPLFSNAGSLPSIEVWRPRFASRITNILETAIENKVEVLILGAFGCGAFHNPPDQVAKQFYQILSTERYRRAFRRVIFAVKRTDNPCPNIDAFQSAFSSFPPVERRTFPSIFHNLISK